MCTAASAGTTCRAAAGSCDPAEACDGSAAACPPDVFAGGSTECRPSSGAGDPAEYCTGTSAACPPDVTGGCTPGTSQPCGSCGTQFCDDTYRWGPCLGDAGSPCDAYCGGYCCDCSHDCPGVGGDWCVDDEHGTCHGGCGSHICP